MQWFPQLLDQKIVKRNWEKKLGKQKCISNKKFNYKSFKKFII